MKKLIYSRHIKGFLLLTATVFLNTSCKKLIQVPANPSNQIPTSQVFSDSTDVMSAVAGIYNNFNVTGSATFGSGAVTVNTGLTGDELVASATVDPSYLQLYQNNIVTSNPAIGSLWSRAYTALYQMNVCLDGISNSNGISGSLKQQLLGEIKVDRAFYYFNLVNLFGGVPLVTSTDYQINKTLPRTAVDTIYNLILSDLTGAQKQLTAVYPSAGRARPNIYTADALLARVYLFKGQWQNAENAANQVINSGLYNLNAAPNTVFLDGSNEAIWQLPANGTYNQTAEAQALIPTTDGVHPATNIVPNYSLSASLLSAFETGDLRKQSWTGTTTVNSNGSNSLYYYAYKYKNRSASAGTTEDYMIIRLAEVYLIRAEALARENKIQAALADLNLIRQRAGLPNSTASSQQDLVNAILHERQTELFCEWGNRWYDLKRTDIINTVLGVEKTSWKSTNILYPVPLAELQSNPFLKQNPGY